MTFPRIVFVLLIVAPWALSQGDETLRPGDKDGPGVQRPLKAGPPASVAATRGTVRRTMERAGTFIPAEAAELKLDLKHYRGELRLVDVVEHGAFVNEGDVLVRLETKKIDEQLRRDRMSLARAEMNVRHVQENGRMAAEKEAEALDKAQNDLARSNKRLKGYRELEKSFNDESERISVQSRKHRLEDQKDELDQLEKMYSEDELVDATEEIVLKRSRRNFARSEASRELSEKRRLYNREWYLPWREEDLERDVRNRSSSLARLKKKQEMDRERRDADLEQKNYDLERQRERLADLEKDRKQFVVRSPRRGIVLHGAAEAAPWPARYKAGHGLKNRAVFMTVAGTREYVVKTEIPEKSVMDIRSGTATEIVPTASKKLKLVGRLQMDFLPTKGGIFPARVPVTAKSDVRLRPGLTGKVVVILEEERDAVLVPVNCVRTEGEKSFLKAAKTAEGPFEEREVVTGLSDGKHIAVRDGLAEGEFVATP